MKDRRQLFVLWRNPLMLALCLVAGSCIAVMAQEGALIGCWKKVDAQSRYQDTISICLRENGELDGGIVDRGHGHDFWGKWERAANNSVILVFGGSDETLKCTFEIRDTIKLLLRECDSQYYSGVFDRIDN
jgi:hypothetical protein